MVIGNWLPLKKEAQPDEKKPVNVSAFLCLKFEAIKTQLGGLGGGCCGRCGLAFFKYLTNNKK